jgi:hypothetical protein
MRHRRPTLSLLTLAAVLYAAPTPARADEVAVVKQADLATANPDVAKAAREMADAAQRLLDSLTKEQRETAAFEFKDNERTNWHFIPKPRKGLPMKDMTPDQRTLAKALLASGLSQKANDQILTLMTMEQILHDIEQGKGPKRDPELYYWSLFGKPGGDAAWGWRVEGHHVSMNFTITAANKAVAAGAPSFLGANPAEVRSGPRKGLRLLADEEDKGRAFVKTLSAEQKSKAIIAQEAPKDIVTGNTRQAVLKKFEGIPYSELNPDQKAALTDLLGLYANRLRPELAQDDLKRIARAGLDKIYFAWAGGIEKGEGHYYRIHSPVVLVEYDDVQNDANHIHTVWRDLENDFGGDLLRKHYDQDHK